MVGVGGIYVGLPKRLGKILEGRESTYQSSRLIPSSLIRCTGVFTGVLDVMGEHLVWAGYLTGYTGEYLTFGTLGTCGRGVTGSGVFMGGSKTFRTFRTSDQNFLKKNAFYVLTSEKYGVIYPAGKNNKKKYNHYVCYIRTDNSDTN